MVGWRWTLPWLAFFGAATLFGVSNDRLNLHARNEPQSEMLVELPRFVQVALLGGDRYLAANVAVLRTLLNRTDSDTHEQYAAQARAQVDASQFNPRHEDNYYLAAALLSWSGYVPDAELILRRAADSRPFDMLPPFFLAFDYYHFDHQPVLGAHWMSEAARRADSESNRISLTRIASRWAEKGGDPREALRLVRVLIAQARYGTLRQFLQLRATRLEGLIVLLDADKSYRQRFGKPASSLDDYVTARQLNQLPVDPLGLGYRLDDQGVPRLNTSPAVSAQSPKNPR